MRYVIVCVLGMLLVANLVLFGRHLGFTDVAQSATDSHVGEQIQLLAQEQSDANGGSTSVDLHVAPATAKPDTVITDHVVDASPNSKLATEGTVKVASPVVALPSQQTTVASSLPTPRQTAVVDEGEVAGTTCRLSPWTADERKLQHWRKQFGNDLLGEQARPLSGEARFLVFIPAKTSKDQSLGRLREIKKLSIESAFLNSGEQEGGISLGLFSKVESAESRLALAKKLGIGDAQVLKREKSGSEYRFLVRFQTGTGDLVDWIAESCDFPIATPPSDQ